MDVRVLHIAACLLLGVSGSAGAQAVPPAGTPGPPATLSAPARDVWNAEVAFARTMADRDHAAFVSFLADEAVFMSETQTLRGRAQVADGWRRFYDAKEAPFSWRPDRVEVLDSGTLASSSGPVFSAQGTRVGTFNSVWRREADGRWRVVFDKGCPPCNGQ